MNQAEIVVEIAKKCHELHMQYMEAQRRVNTASNALENAVAEQSRAAQLFHEAKDRLVRAAIEVET